MSSDERQQGNVPIVRIDDDEMIDLASLLNEEPTTAAPAPRSKVPSGGTVHAIDVGDGDADFEALLQRTLGGGADDDEGGDALPFGVGAARPPLPKKPIPRSREDLLNAPGPGDGAGGSSPPAPPRSRPPGLGGGPALSGGPGSLSKAPGGQWQVPQAGPGRPDPRRPEQRRRDRDEPSEEAKRVEELRKKVKEMSADTERFKKRLQDQAAAARDKGREDVFVRIIPILDTLRLALESAQEGAEMSSVVDGLTMLVKQFGNELRGLGLEELESDGAVFDPKSHEAFQHVKTGTVPPGNVAQTVRRGYRFKDRLIRPAQVTVESS